MILVLAKAKFFDKHIMSMFEMYEAFLNFWHRVNGRMGRMRGWVGMGGWVE
jgi:hypothetical protein